MADRALLRLHRVTDLFVNGRELLLRDGARAEEPVLLWIGKLNTFQRGDAHRDGEAAQARRVAGLSSDSDEMRAAGTQLAQLTRQERLDFILQPQDGQFYVRGQDDVKTDQEWMDKLSLLERHQQLEADGSPPTDAEREQIGKIQSEYFQAVDAAAAKRRADAVADMADLDDAEIAKRYLDTVQVNLGEGAYWQEFRRSELFLSIRDCAATRAGGGGFDHARCTHRRLLPDKASVVELPQELLERVRQVITDINMAAADAGNAAAPVSSSAPSEQPSSAEASPDSSLPEG